MLTVFERLHETNLLMYARSMVLNFVRSMEVTVSTSDEVLECKDRHLKVSFRMQIAMKMCNCPMIETRFP